MHCPVSPDDENEKVGGDVWCAALLLSAWLLENPEVVRGLDVLELGSGLGLCGITAGYLAKSVMLTGKGHGLRWKSVRCFRGGGGNLFQ